MVHKKIGIKLKIAAIMAAMLVVVSSVAAYNALATNSSDSQSGVSSGAPSDNTVTTLSSDTGVEIVSNGYSWSADEASAPVIGTYTIDSFGTPTSITSNVINWDNFTMEAEMSGVTHSGEEIYVDEAFAGEESSATIQLSKAGIYSVTITLFDDTNEPVAQETLYAKIAKHKVQKADGLDGDVTKSSLTYSHKKVQGGIKSNDTNIMKQTFDYHVEGYYFLDSEDTERVRIVDGVVERESDDVSFSVINAGDYKVYVSLNDTDNYEWSDAISATLNADGYKEIGSFTIKQAYTRTSNTSSNYNRWDPSNPSTLQFELEQGFTEENITSQLLSMPYHLSGDKQFYGRLAFYKDSNYTQLITNNEFEVGTVYAQVVGFSGVNGDNVTYRNYCLPPENQTIIWQQFRCSFKITECKISKPVASNAAFLQELNGKYSTPYTGLFNESSNEHPKINGNNIIATYQGWDYDFSQFIMDWETTYLNGGALSVTVEGLSGQNPKMRNVPTHSNSQATAEDGSKYAAYVISVTPAENFAWDNGNRDTITYYLAILPKTLSTENFQWSDEYHEYNGESHSFDDGCVVNGLFEGDNLTATLDIQGRDPIYKYYDDEGEKLEQPEIIGYKDPTNAGYYPTTVTELSGDSKDNYALPTYVIDHRFIIYRKRLPQMPASPIVKGTFNGEAQEFSLLETMKGLELIMYNDKNEAIPIAISESITCSYPSEWNTGSSSLTNHGASVYLAGNFTATHAGYYTIKFMINSAVQMNYCWYGENNLPRESNDNAPDEYVWNNFAFIDRVEVPSVQLPSDKHYIAVGNDFVDISAAITDILGEKASLVNILGFGVVGSDLTNANQQAVDCDESGKHKVGNYYALIELKNKENLADIVFGASVSEYFENLGNGKAKVYYSVASNVINFGYDVKDYTFGDDVILENVVTRVSQNLPHGVTAGAVSYAFYTDNAMENLLDESLLKNGLPRNAGTYYLRITVQLTGAEESSWSNDVAYELTVNKLPVNVKWSIDGKDATDSSVYDGHNRVISAINTNTVAGVSVALTLSGIDNVKNAKNYTFTVVGITGDDADNFTLEGADNISYNYEITPIYITVSATELNKTIGIDKVSASELTFTLTQGEFLAGEESNLSVWLYKNGERFTDFDSYLTAGSYVLVPVWDNTSPDSVGNYTKTLENYVLTMKTAKLNVGKQKLTITLLDGANSVYGEKIDLYRADVYAVSINLTVEQLKEILELTLKDRNNQAVNLDRANAGFYSIEVSVKADGDYSVEVVNETAEYEVKKRVIKIKADDANHTYGDSKTKFTCGVTLTDGTTLADWDKDTDLLELLNLSIEGYEDTGFGETTINYPNINVGQYICRATQFAENANYDIAENKDGVLSVIPRSITITFTSDGNSSEYGETINLLKQPESAEGKPTMNGKYIICDVTGLRFNGVRHYLGDAAVLSLVKDSNEFTDMTKVPAGTYLIKITANDNYTIVGGVTDGGKEGAYIVGGKYVVNPKDISLTLTVSKNSLTYGNTLAQESIVLGFNVNGALAAGDTKDDLGVTVGIVAKNSNTNVADNIATQNAGDYYVVLVECANSNYNVISVPALNFTINKRNVVAQPVDLTHVYGDVFTVGNLTFTVDDLVNNDTKESLNLTIGVYNGLNDITDSIAIQSVGDYTISLKETTEIQNYIVTCKTAKFEIIQRQITIEAKDVLDHLYGKPLGTNELDKTISTTNGTSGDPIVSESDLHSLDIRLQIFDGETPVTDVASLKAGHYTVKVIYTENGNYAVTPVFAKFDVVTLEVTITFKSGASSVYGDEIDLSQAFEIEGLLDADKNSYSVTAKLNGVEASSSAHVGTYTVEVTITNSNYTVNYTDGKTVGEYKIVEREVTLTPNAVTHTYGNVYDAETPSYTVTGKGFVGNDESGMSIRAIVRNASGADVTGTIAQQNVSGSYTVELTYTENTNYMVTIGSPAAFTIGQREITITFGADGTSVYGQNVDLYKSVSSYNGIIAGYDFKNVVKLTATKDGVEMAVTNPDAGDYVVTPSVDNGNFVLASGTGTGVYKITKATLTVTVNNFDIIYGSELSSVGITDSTLPRNLYSATSPTLGESAINAYIANVTYTTTYTTATNVGSASITPVLIGDDNVTVNPVSGVITVKEAEITINGVTSGHLTGAYTGEAFKLFATMNAEAVNNQTIIWYYREAGQSEWTEYSGNTLTDVCEKHFEVQATARNHNAKIYWQVIDFVITQNSITIKADDQSVIYGDDLSGITFTSKIVYADGQTRLTSAAEQFYLSKLTSASYTVNYTAVTTGVGSIDIEISCEGDDNVVITPANGTLKVNKRTITLTFTSNGGTSVYGDNNVDLYSTSVGAISNLANGHRYEDVVRLSGILKNAEDDVTLPKAPAGEYEVTAALANSYKNNYDLVCSGSGKYVIAKRIITATLDKSSVEYTEDESGGIVNYHKGEYGAAHNAVVKFKDVLNGDVLSANSDYTVLYNTVTGNGQTAGKAPVKAGEYQVTVTVTNTNYTFAENNTSATFSFTVTPKTFDESDFSWTEEIVKYEANIQLNSMRNYNSNIMDIVRFTKIYAGTQEPTVISPNGNAGQGNSYYFDSEGRLNIAALGRAKYEVTFEISILAGNNYTINTSDGQVSAAFYIVNDDIVMTLKTTDWQYWDIPVLPNEENGYEGNIVASINDTKTYYGFAYYYARVTDSTKLNELLELKKDPSFTGFDQADVKDLYSEMIEWPTEMANGLFEVDYYVICVRYDGIVSNGSTVDYAKVEKYDIVKVSKKQLEISKTLGETTFNGKTQGAEIDFDMPCEDGSKLNIKSWVTALFNGSAVESKITGRDVRTYEVILTVNDTDRFVWADTMEANAQGEVTVSWTIIKDTADNADGKYFSVNNIDDITYGESVTLIAPTLKLTSYLGTFIWYYAEKGSMTAPPADESAWTEWNESSKPTNAGEYFVKVVLSAANKNNFTDKVGYTDFTINKKDLRIKLSGSLEYGKAFAQRDCGFTIVEDDLIANDKGNANIVKVVGTGMTYYLVDINGDQITNTRQLEVDIYRLTALLDGNDRVDGLTAQNYNIVLFEDYGDFNVTKKTITVTIGDASSQYGCDIADLENVVDVIYTDGVDTNIVIAGVKAALRTDATNTSEVRDENYTIESNYLNRNFIINYTNGVYKITPRKVYVTLNDGTGTYSDSASFVEATIATITDDKGADIAAFVKDKYTITVVYNGTANDGNTTYSDSLSYPTLAGTYTATAQGDDTNKNFTVVNGGSASFTVSRFAVDCSNITAKTTIYDESPITPDIVDTNNYNGVSSETIYTVQLPTGGCEAADTYTLTLILNDEFNYEWKDGANTIMFVIANAGIYVRPSGRITYGQSINYDDIEFTFILAKTGKVITAEDGIVINIDRSKIRLKFIDAINETRPEAREYRLSFDDENGFVLGFETENYNFALEKDQDKNVVYGTYTVDKKAVTIVAGSSNSVYGQTITLSDEFYLADGEELAFDDEQITSVIKTYSPFLINGTAVNVGNYDVSANVTSDNYDVTVNKGTHKIAALKIALTLKATNGVYIDTPAAVTVENLRTTNLSTYVFASDFVEKYIIISIIGVNGTEYSDSVIPQNAGSYKATVTGINNTNFELDVDACTLTDTFEIAKKLIDHTAITIAESIYNGQDQTHGLADNDQYTVSKGVYHDADTYTITLTLNNGNYAWIGTESDTVEKLFVIKKAELTLIPAGSLTYGQSFDQYKCSYELKGFVGGDNESVVSGFVTYMLSGGISGEALTVKADGYDLIVAVTDGYVSGLSAKNYNIKANVGNFVVNKRPITIQPVSTVSVYSQAVVVSQQFDVTYGEFVFGDTKDVIEYSAYIAGNAISAGKYDILANAYSDNYEVTVIKGTHTVEQIKVGVVVRAIDGVYGDDNQRGSIEIMSAVVTNLGANPTAIDGLQFIIMYSGRSYSGVQFNSANVPTLAGMYTARVTGVDDANYAIDLTYGIHSTMLVIKKHEVNTNYIKVKSMPYTSKPIVPEIIDTVYNDGAIIYTVNYEGPFVNAGKYDVTLTLADTNNYCWKNGDGNSTTIEFEITKAENKLVDESGSSLGNVQIKVQDWTYGDPSFKPQANVLSGAAEDIVFEYSDSENGAYTTLVPTNVGTYWVRATMSESDNYNAFTSKAVSFTISKRSVAIPELQKVTEGDGRNDTYTGTLLYSLINNYDERVMRLSYDGMCRINEGTATISALDAGTYTATLTLIDPDNYVWADNSQLVDGKVVVTWTINRQVISVLPSASNKIVVNGENITFIPEGFNSGIMEISGNIRAHEGNYTAIVTLKDTKNYAWEGTENDSIGVDFELTGTNTVFIAIICVVAGLCVGLAVMAVILTVVYRRKKRKEQEAIDERSRAEGWND